MSEFCTAYLGFQLMPFHKKILEALFGGGEWDIMLPTDHGKSTLCNVIFPILSLASNPDGAHILIGANVRDATSWVDVVADHFRFNEPLIRDFPWLGRPTGGTTRRWNSHEITIAGRGRGNRNPSLAAFGRGAGDVKGRRGMTICDDLEGAESISQVERDRLYEWMMKEALRTEEDASYNPRRLFANIGTPFDPDSIHIRLINEHGFQVFRQPYKYDSGRLIWPMKKQKVLARYRQWSPEQFAIAMQLDPTGGREDLLSMDQIIAKTNAKGGLSAEGVTYINLDPASGSQTTKADYAGISVVRYDWPIEEQLPAVTVLACTEMKLGALEQVHLCARLHGEYGVPVIVEGNSQQQGTYKMLFQQYHPEVPIIIYITQKRTKHDPVLGISILRTLLRADKLTILEEGQGAQSLRKELRDVGSKHDHLMMSIWFGIRQVYERGRYRRQPAVRIVSRMGPGRMSNFTPGQHRIIGGGQERYAG